ncbi:autophagy-related protein 27, partial [Amylocystis lapponica]
AAQDDGSPFECYITYDNRKYDLTSLAGEHTLKRTRETPPTTMVDTVVFNLCADLQQQDGVNEADQCPSGTRACLTKTNSKGSEADRIVAVIPLAKSSVDDMEYSALSSPKGISVTFNGPTYPSTTSPDLIPQSFNVKLLCAAEASDPQFSSYDGKQLSVEWSAPAGCQSSGEPGPDNGEKPADDIEDGGGSESVGSGVGYFFLLLCIVVVGYFALGAYYNYSTYGASGLDLIPHRDFWREVPYMLRDVVSHLCSAVRPRQSASRGGYIAV